jgi:hypothetical protein
MKALSRRQVLLLGIATPILPLAGGCRADLPRSSTVDTAAEATRLLLESAEAHGLAAFSSVRDVNVSYTGHWRRLVAKLQPELVDARFRGGSEERLLVQDGIIAQAHQGPGGTKQVVRTYPSKLPPEIQVWFNGQASQDRAKLDAAALVAEAYALFLLGPILLVTNQHPQRGIQASLAPPAAVKQAGQTHACNVVLVRMSPGLGNSMSDQLAIYLDKETHLMRRVRMTLNGLESTQGALVDIDTYDHRAIQHLVWPTTFHERLLRPAPLDVHAWHLTGLDINRGELPGDVANSVFRGAASAPAAPLTA